MIGLQKIPWYHISFSESITFCLPDIHEVDWIALQKDLKNKTDNFRLGCLHINLWDRACVRAFFPGCRMKNGTYLVSDVDPLCRNSYNLPLTCSKKDVYTVLTYLCHIYTNNQ